MIMTVKKFLRKLGYDVVKYHPCYDILLKKHAIDTVLDIGANNGQFAREINKKIPRAMIYSFEPLPDVFRDLQENCSSITNFKAFNLALGERNENIVIHRSSFSPSSSLLKMSELHKRLYPKSSGAIQENVAMKKLDHVARKIELHKNILVKIDVQGFEDKVIAGGQDIISRAKLLLVETSFVTLYENQPLFDDIYTLVRNLGFTYAGSKERHYNKETGELIYEDSIFVKK